MNYSLFFFYCVVFRNKILPFTDSVAFHAKDENWFKISLSSLITSASNTINNTYVIVINYFLPNLQYSFSVLPLTEIFHRTVFLKDLQHW